MSDTARQSALVEHLLGPRTAFHTMPEMFCYKGMRNMISLALNLSHYSNGAAKKHGEVARHIFAHSMCTGGTMA